MEYVQYSAGTRSGTGTGTAVGQRPDARYREAGIDVHAASGETMVRWARWRRVEMADAEVYIEMSIEMDVHRDIRSKTCQVGDVDIEALES